MVIMIIEIIHMLTIIISMVLITVIIVLQIIETKTNEELLIRSEFRPMQPTKTWYLVGKEVPDQFRNYHRSRAVSKRGKKAPSLMRER